MAAKRRKKAKKKTKAKAKKRKTKAKKKPKAKKRKTTKSKKRKTTKAKKKPKAKKKSKAKKKPKAKKKKKGKKRKPNAAFMRPLRPSPILAAIVGSKPLPRTQATKKLWQYIKRKNLQDKVNRRNINADGPMLKLFNGKRTVNMFEMTKYVSKHLK